MNLVGQSSQALQSQPNVGNIWGQACPRPQGYSLPLFSRLKHGDDSHAFSQYCRKNWVFLGLSKA